MHWPQDLLDIQALQDPDYIGIPKMKAVFIGDKDQLPPVKDIEAIKPDGCAISAIK